MSTQPDGPIDLGTLLTWREASTAGSAIAAALEVARSVPRSTVEALRDADRVVLTGAGSSYYVAQAAAAVGRETAGLPFVAAPLSEVMLRPSGVFGHAPRREALVVISRSGSTSEALVVAAEGRAAGRPTFGATCRGASPLAGLVDSPMVVPAGDESAIVMTRSFASMLALLLRVIADLADTGSLAADLDRSPECWSEVEAAATAGLHLGETDWSRVVILGGGAAFGIASEWALKLTETSQVPAYAYQPLEFRHGPISLCEPGVLVVGLLGGPGAGAEDRVLRESAALGATTWTLTSEGVTAARGSVTVDVVGRGLHPSARLPLLLYPGHALALMLALTRGKDPDAPRHLGQVVVIDPR